MSKPNRTPEEVAAIEKKLEADIEAVLQRLIAAHQSKGEAVFARVTAAIAFGRAWERLLDEDPDCARIFSETDRVLVRDASQRVADGMMRFFHAAMKANMN